MGRPRGVPELQGQPVGVAVSGARPAGRVEGEASRQEASASPPLQGRDARRPSVLSSRRQQGDRRAWRCWEPPRSLRGSLHLPTKPQVLIWFQDPSPSAHAAPSHSTRLCSPSSTMTPTRPLKGPVPQAANRNPSFLPRGPTGSGVGALQLLLLLSPARFLKDRLMPRPLLHTAACPEEAALALTPPAHVHRIPEEARVPISWRTAWLTCL